MGDDKGKKKSGGGAGGMLFKVLALIVLVGILGEIAARFTGNFDLSPLTQLQRLLKR
jgi:hypothetical protein